MITQSVLNMPPIILGTFQVSTYKELLGIVEAGTELGFSGFDTSPSYRNEGMLGKALKESMLANGIARDRYYIIDKIDAWQMQAKSGNVSKFAENALKKIGIDYLDLLLIHWPIPEFFVQTWHSLIMLHEKGKVRSIGVCNTRERHIFELKKHGLLTPMVAQIERHPLRTVDDMIEYHNRNGIVTQAYSPLCRMAEVLTCSVELIELSRRYDKTIGQIILRWHIQTGVVPVFMSKKPERIRENLSVFDFSMTPKEIGLISKMNQNYKLFPESWGCPGF